MAFTPTDPLKAEVRVVGTAPNQQLDFYIPRGPKGDPGGFAASTILAAGTNFDTIITSGLYLNPQANAANGPSNSTNGGHLEVIASANWVYQRYTPISEQRETYVRHRTSSSVWSAWAVHNTTRVDQTAGRVIYQWDDVNNREQMIYGDTGVRDIIASHGNGTFGALSVRRVGSMVNLWATNWTAPANSASPFTTMLGAGFRNLNTLHGAAAVGDVALTNFKVSANFSQFYVHNVLASQVISFNVTYLTSDIWPTTLPGVASGTIPNL